MNINPKILNSVGLFMDIIGAWLIAWEVYRQFKGKKYSKAPPLPPPRAAGVARESDQYKRWGKKKYFRMAIGLGLLTIGFLLQIISNWM